MSPLQRRTWSGVGRVHGGSSCWGRNCDFLFVLFLKHFFFFLVLKVIQVLCNKNTWGKTIRIIIPPAPPKKTPTTSCVLVCVSVCVTQRESRGETREGGKGEPRL